MKEIMDWILQVEESARRIYEKASLRFVGDEKLSALLMELSMDEKEHFDLLLNVYPCIANEEASPGIKALFKETQRQVDDYFMLCEKRVSAGTLTKSEIKECLVFTELSQYNQLFVEIIKTLRESTSESDSICEKMDCHKLKIERYLNSEPDATEHLKAIRSLPMLRLKKVLIVNDDSLICDLMSDLFYGQMNIVTVGSEPEAYTHICSGCFDCFVLDLDMDCFDVMEFYKRIIHQFPDSKENFLFLLTCPDSKCMDFFKKDNIRYVTKVSPISEIKEAITDASR